MTIVVPATLSLQQESSKNKKTYHESMALLVKSLEVQYSISVKNGIVNDL